MSYRISYTSKGTYKRIYRQIMIPPVLSLAVSVAIILLIGYFSFSNNIDHTMYMLFPWTEHFTRSAILKMEESIHNGIPMIDAITAFCRDIISGASI